MDENLETKDENMKDEMTHSSIVQLLEILKLCNAQNGIVAKDFRGKHHPNWSDLKYPT
jgi:hypothetical protein